MPFNSIPEALEDLKQGKMIVLVIPESQTYRREFVTPETLQKFETVLAEARARVPEVLWVRLDKDDDVLNSLMAIFKEKDIHDGAVLNAVGNLAACKFRDQDEHRSARQDIAKSSPCLHSRRVNRTQP